MGSPHWRLLTADSPWHKSLNPQEVERRIGRDEVLRRECAELAEGNQGGIFQEQRGVGGGEFHRTPERRTGRKEKTIRLSEPPRPG